MQVWLIVGIALIAIMITRRYRSSRDREQLTTHVGGLGGQVLKLTLTKKGHPFPSIGRGWWSWRVEWRNEAGEQRTAWALTTRDGIKEWSE